MTSESPSTSKAEPQGARTDDASRSGDDAGPATRPSRVRTAAPTRSAPRRRPVASPGERSAPPPPLPTPQPAPFRTRRLEETTGPNPDAAPEEVRLVVGVIVGVHGIRGELKVQLWTDAPDHLRNVRLVWVGGERAQRRMSGVRINRDRALIRLSGVTTPEIGRTFVGQNLYISGKDARPLDDGELFLYQLVGLKVQTEAGEPVGTSVDVIETGANDVIVIRPTEGGPDILHPHHRDFVLGVDLAAGTMTIRLLDYLN